MGEGTVYSHLVGPGWSCVFVGPAPKENGPIHRFERSRIVSAPPAARTAEALSRHVPLPVLMGPIWEPPALMPAVPFFVGSGEIRPTRIHDRRVGEHVHQRRLSGRECALERG